MSRQEAKASAAKYLREQAEIMKKYGKSAKLSGPDYQEALKNTAKTFQSLAASNRGDETK